MPSCKLDATTPGRNAPCPCGSGAKYKRCCGGSAPRAVPPFSAAAVPLPGAVVAPSSTAAAHLRLGDARYDRGDFQAAIVSYRRALELKPDLAQAHDALGMALQSLGTPDAALASHRRALALQPDYADAYGNLGNALMTLGLFKEAALSYRRMCELLPQSAEAHNRCGNALLASGQLAEAAACYRVVAALRPGSAVAFANLGNALRGLGMAREAASSCRRAVELQPGFAEAHRYLGNACFDLGEFDQAAASYERALAIDPGLAEAHSALGIVLRQVGRGEAAEACCRRALQLKPDAPETLALLGDIQAGQGDFAAAEASFKRVQAIKPDLPEGWAGIARYRKMSHADAGWLEAVQRLLGTPLPLQHSINLHYALGKYFDDVQDFEQAFANYRLANELTRRYGIRYDRRRQADRVDRMIAAYDRPWLEAARSANMSETPVFIVGMPRAGTTLAEQILASHPAVRGAGELRFWHAAAAGYEKSSSSREGGAAIAALSGHYAELLAGLAGNAPRVVDKMPANTMNLGLIHAAFPKARIIHLRRHPIDTCLSIYFQAFSNTHSYANDLEDLAHHYRQYSRSMTHWRAVLPEAAILDVPYESLVEAPEPWSRKMIEFLGLAWDPRCLDFHRTPRTVLTASSWQVRQKISTASAGRWRHYERFVGPLRPLPELCPHG